MADRLFEVKYRNIDAIDTIEADHFTFDDTENQYKFWNDAGETQLIAISPEEAVRIVKWKRNGL